MINSFRNHQDGVLFDIDDAFRTLLNDCTRLIISVINEVFHTTYALDDEIQLSGKNTRKDLCRAVAKRLTERKYEEIEEEVNHGKNNNK
ncbi:MAG: hypothetical protein ACI4HI_18225 [Lachnospiraceae bacterium]